MDKKTIIKNRLKQFKKYASKEFPITKMYFLDLWFQESSINVVISI